MGELSDSSIPTVVVTGFGPFRNHMKNSSWLTVQELLTLNVSDFQIIAKELPVEYEAVTEIVPVLWKKYNPKLMVHCGMSEQATCLTLEQVACNKYYLGPDVQGRLPVDNMCCSDGPLSLRTTIDVEQVLKDVGCSGVCVTAESSVDAGKYLCEFIFYSSLKICTNTAFIHVPPLDQPYSAREMAEALIIIIRSMLKQVESCS